MLGEFGDNHPLECSSCHWQSEDRLTSAIHDSRYSSKFSILLPDNKDSTSGQFLSRYELSDVPVQAQSLPPLFPPPPFTPSHPVFLHFTSVAASYSDKFRAEAEARISNFAHQQLQEVQRKLFILMGETSKNIS